MSTFIGDAARQLAAADRGCAAIWWVVVRCLGAKLAAVWRAFPLL